MRVQSPAFSILAALVVLSAFEGAHADTLIQALASAYSSNPEINSARAGTRATDENIAIAKSFARPTITGDLSLSASAVNSNTGFGGEFATARSVDGSVGITAEQFVFRGFRTRNAVRQAEADVRSSREEQQNTVQNVLFDAAEAYTDVLRDLAVLNVRRRSVAFLQEQVRAATDRFNVGENTRTDVAQARAALSLAQSEVSLAEANLATSSAAFRRVVGREPRNLRPATLYSRLIPKTVRAAVEAGQMDHPAIIAAIHQADSDAFAVKQVEGELLPTVTVQGTLARDFGVYDSRPQPNSADDITNSATIVGRISVPIYQGGALSARVRQAKELLGQSRIQIDLTRDQVRAAVVSAWGQLQASAGAISAAGAQVEAANIALAGVQEEQAVGQRTTLDVLNAQQDLLDARINLIEAQRDRIVASYSLLSAMGRLTAERLGLPVELYRPEEHYAAVKDKWFGLRTPDGR